MSAVSVETFNSYVGSYEDDTDGLKQIYIDSAEAMVRDYLGYDFNENEYTELFRNDGKMIQLAAFPVTLTSVNIDGVVVPLSEFTVVKEKLFYLSSHFNKDSATVVAHTSGNEIVPGIIKLVVLQIAALLFTESNGNIGVTSKSSLDNNTRTFVKTTSFQPYLSKLDGLVIRRL